MNKKFEDVKINSKKVMVKSPKMAPVVLNEENHNPTRIVPSVEIKNDVSKYDFLDKKTKTSFSSSPRIPQTPRLPKSRKSLSGKIIFLFILSLIVGAFYLLSTTFLHSNLTVIAKSKTFDLKNQKFTANKDGSLGAIPFILTVVSGTEKRDIVLTSSKEASDKAKGSITLYNEYSTKVQKIGAGTFISDENGKTYKTDTTVSIPGYTLDKTKKIIPGFISVGITAFLPGDAYNGEPKDFSINSFKGTDKYKKIYGKAETSLSGGATGLVYLMDDKQKLELDSVDLSKFKEKLFNKIEIPTGYILYENTVRYNIDFNKDIMSKTPDANIEIKGTASAMLLKESDLSNSIISKLLPDISAKERAEIIAPDVTKLSFDFTDSNQLVSKDVESFEFELTGPIFIKWNPYTEELKSLIAGKYKTEVPSFFKQDPGISSASVKIIPFWSKKLPKDIKNINIILK